MNISDRRDDSMRWVWLAIGLGNLGLAFYLARLGLFAEGQGNGTGEALIAGLVTCFGLLCALTSLPFFVWSSRARTLGAPPGTLGVLSALFLAAVPWLVVITFWLH